MSSRGADTRVGACARPRVILRSLNQPCLDGIVLDIRDNPIHFGVVADPVIVGFALPKMLACPSKNLVRFSSSEAFQSSKQERRPNFRQEQNMDVVGHQDPSPKLKVAEFNASVQGRDYQLRNRFQSQVQRAFLRGVEIAVHPDKSFSGGKFSGWRVSPLGKAPVQMPRSEDPFSFRILMGQAAHRPLVLAVDCNSQQIHKRRHECRRGRHECPRHHL
jgi:hypothetical protein